jgi:hypothetical protein
MKELTLSEVIEDISKNYNKEDFYKEIYIESAIVDFASEDTSCHMAGSAKLCYGSEGMNVYVGPPGSDPRELGKAGSNFLSLLMSKEGEYSVGKLMGDSPKGLIITRAIKTGATSTYFSTLEVFPQEGKEFFEEG